MGGYYNAGILLRRFCNHKWFVKGLTVMLRIVWMILIIHVINVSAILGVSPLYEQRGSNETKPTPFSGFIVNSFLHRIRDSGIQNPE